MFTGILYERFSRVTYERSPTRCRSTIVHRNLWNSCRDKSVVAVQKLLCSVWESTKISETYGLWLEINFLVVKALSQAIHGDTCLTCIHCSGIAFNHTAIQNHMKSHEEKKVRYSCGTCLCTFASDLALFDHLSVAHGVSLYYFCKVCGFGSTSADSVFQHISIHNGHNYVRHLIYKPFIWISHFQSLVQRFGACPAQLLNYDPTDELEFRSQILNKTIQLVSPSDCSHRSMLLQCETVVSCKTCHCTVSEISTIFVLY